MAPGILRVGPRIKFSPFSHISHLVKLSVRLVIFFFWTSPRNLCVVLVLNSGIISWKRLGKTLFPKAWLAPCSQVVVSKYQGVSAKAFENPICTLTGYPFPMREDSWRMDPLRRIWLNSILPFEFDSFNLAS